MAALCHERREPFARRPGLVRTRDAHAVEPIMRPVSLRKASGEPAMGSEVEIGIMRHGPRALYPVTEERDGNWGAI